MNKFNLDMLCIKEWVYVLDKNNLEGALLSSKQYYQNEILVKEVLRDLDEGGRKNDLKGFEIPKGVYLTAEAFTIDNNMLTPTMKMKGNEIKKRYAAEIEKMYKNGAK